MASLRRHDIEATATGLRRLLAAIAANELTAGSGEIARLEGALAALEALLGEPAATSPRHSDPEVGT